jgi:hypothetical protein
MKTRWLNARALLCPGPHHGSDGIPARKLPLSGLARALGRKKATTVTSKLLSNPLIGS